MKHPLLSISALVLILATQLGIAQVEEVEPPKPLTAILTPNAATSSVRLEVQLSRPDDLQVVFHSLTGLTSQTERYDQRTSGTHEFTIDVTNLAAGLYVVRISTSTDVVTKGVVLVR